MKVGLAPMIDAHVHSWETGDDVWIRTRVGALEGAFPLARLEPLARSVGIGRVILVQAAQTATENLRCLDLCHASSFVAGVVGWVDIQAPDMRRRLAELSRHRALVGIRPLPAATFGAGWWRGAAMREAFTAMARYGLVADVLALPEELDDVARAARDEPELRIVLNHGGRPRVMCGGIAHWERRVRRVAASTNVFCKCSGLVERAGIEWTVQSVRPYVEVLLDAFGADRLMFASNWPVLNLASHYVPWLECVMECLQTLGLSADERDAVMGGTARRCYALR